MKFSIITPTYNSSKTIQRSLSSILKQTYKNYEVIIIDNKSTDKTFDIIKKNQKLHKNITFISKKDKGIYDAINKGIKISKGSIISILNSDDFFFNKNVLLNVKNQFLKNKKIDIIIGNTLILKKGSIFRYYKAKYFKPWEIFFGNMPPHPSSFVKRKIYKKIGMYNTDYKIASDFDFFLRIYKKNINIKLLDKNYVFMSAGGVSNKNLLSHLSSSNEINLSLRKNNYFSILPLTFLRFFFKIKQFIL